MLGHIATYISERKAKTCRLNLTLEAKAAVLADNLVSILGIWGRAVVAHTERISQLEMQGLVKR